MADVVATCEGMAVTWEEGRRLAGKGNVEGRGRRVERKNQKGFMMVKSPKEYDEGEGVAH